MAQESVTGPVGSSVGQTSPLSSEPVVLPMIPEPVEVKLAYQAGELTEDEALELLFPGITRGST